ncbi:MAG: hypothetical protein Q8S47_00260, partial [Phenylobacterium sp.]|nr:hypothetical protein [Phenylobacterium sp.]
RHFANFWCRVCLIALSFKGDSRSALRPPSAPMQTLSSGRPIFGGQLIEGNAELPCALAFRDWVAIFLYRSSALQGL